MNYYNEWDKPTAAWLQELINQGLIPNGHIDTRSIADVQPGDLDGYTQCHFFAGIGGWPLALQLAGWPTDRPVWTGSCPCQPFSAAGKQKGHDDERHVWPEMFRLARVCRPDTIFGEQVEGAVRLGWLDGVSADLETEGYAVGAAVLGAHSVGAPHIRQRLYWVADCGRLHSSGRRVTGDLACAAGDFESEAQQRQRMRDAVGNGGSDGGLPYAGCAGPSQQRGKWHKPEGLAAPSGAGGVSNAECVRCELQPVRQSTRVQHALDVQDESFLTTSSHSSGFCGLSNTNERAVIRGGECEFGATRQQVAQQGNGSHPSNHPDHRNEVGAYWSEFDILPFLDGKARRIEPGTFPLVDGLPRGVVPSGDIGESYAQATSEGRVMRLKGYGNAIVPQVAAEFIGAYMADRKAEA